MITCGVDIIKIDRIKEMEKGRINSLLKMN